MSAIVHHPPDALLADYATGTLPEGFALAVATHVSLCDACRAGTTGFEAVGGALLERLEPVPLTVATPESVLDRAAPETGAAATGGGTFPLPLAAYVGPGPEAVAWQQIDAGISEAPLRCGGAARARLLYVTPGRTLAAHRHDGWEVTLVLDGAFCEGGSRLARGDMSALAPGSSHHPYTETDTHCLVLTATDAPLRV